MRFRGFVRSIAVLLAFVVVASNAVGQTAQQTLTGDPATACQVILCLSSGKRPTECNAPLSKYFSISMKYWSDTVTARKNFLQLCPAASQTSTTNMPALVDAMANGAGQCDATNLNQIMMAVPVQKCDGYGQDRSCWTEDVYVVNPQEPAYCVDYTTNSNTYMLGLTYVGTPLQGGHWVDNSTGQ